MSLSINNILEACRKKGASDLHLSTGESPYIRVNGEIEPMPNTPIMTKEMVESLIAQTLTPEVMMTYLEEKDIDYSFKDEKNRRYRCNAFYSLKGPCFVFRFISENVITEQSLNIPGGLDSIMRYKRGLVLVTGPIGSGKSTTMTTIVDALNTHKDDHILMIEDPVEFVHKSKKSLINQREVKVNTHSFANALKSALREDPDTIIVGEMRDQETIGLALEAAETGHFVIGTLHTSGAESSITKIIDAFPYEEQGQIRSMLAGSISCIISQVLCQKADKSGRIAAFESLYATTGIRSLIRNNKVFQIRSEIQTGRKYNMTTLEQSLKKLVTEGTITEEEALKYVINEEAYKVA